ncbi:cysteine-rich receptor-like protein kinase 15 [Corylus avellana]|uniref:cysteine-rich receptor-like protein kinase 15 n=1 Tax=Corylus avellana TaxID=13451 RepID=UPI00286D5CB3|nr:cysteine-rich receptor-like protein kinase 15 [Corylus avellana]
MEKNIVSAMLFLIIPLLMRPVLASGDPVYTFCNPESRNYALSSPFENNLNLLLESLPSNTSVKGFYNNSTGEDPDEVYGQALCRGDVNSTVCRDCIKNASQEILKQCKTEDATIWFKLCQVRYSGQNFSSFMVYFGMYPDQNNLEKNLSINPVRFDKVLTYLIDNISSEAAFDPSKRMFATGEIKFSREKTIYGLVQCTWDISESSCYSCLVQALGDLHACCDSRQGGIIVTANCNVRFQLYQFYNASSVFLTYPSSKGPKLKIWMVVVIACIPISIIAVLVGSCAVYHGRNKRTQRGDGVAITQNGELVSAEELSFMDLLTIVAATDNFSESNKLGKGGFGTVYKGVLPDGKEVAVKRLSRKSWQGLEELKNEVILIAKLQHRNLVKLLGCGIEGEEKLLIYEFMPNRSLDFFIFDSKKRTELDWKTCYNVIVGIARGLLYLHEDSRLKIIHRDLKPNNVLLDHEMVAKISDFGMARIFGENQYSANTQRVVGTYGYMAPEYAMEGLFSVKSDVFSFGVILLEIISGKKNSGFYLTEHAQTLLAYAWRLWNEGKELEFVDPLLMESCQTTEVLKCMHIGLLCVQEDPADRPTISSVLTLLGNESTSLPHPKQPLFVVARVIQTNHIPTTNPSVNHLTISGLSPR